MVSSTLSSLVSSTLSSLVSSRLSSLVSSRLSSLLSSTLLSTLLSLLSDSVFPPLAFYLDMPPRRKGKANKKQKVATTPEEVAASVNLEEGWLDKFLELPPDDLAKLLADIANHGKVKTAAFKKARTSLPSFSSVKWIDFAEKFGLHNRLENNKFEQVITPKYCLPPSIHEIMFEAAWRTQDVYQERQVQRREAARVRIMDPVCLQSHLLYFFDLKICPVPCSDHRAISRSSN